MNSRTRRQQLNPDSSIGLFSSEILDDFVWKMYYICEDICRVPGIASRVRVQKTVPAQDSIKQIYYSYIQWLELAVSYYCYLYLHLLG